MALINCKECGKEISDKAINCPDCGCPINQDTVSKEITSAKKVAIVCIIILVIVILVGFIFGYFIPAHSYTTLKDGKQVTEFKLFK